MNRCLLCTGEVAKTPYYFEKVYANIYSIEELCYVLYENAFLIDRDILDKKLVDWIDTGCKLHDLARALYTLINQNALPSSFVGTILEYVGYYSQDEITKVESILRLNASVSVFEKWKAKADFLFENNNFLLALKEYERALTNIGEDELDLRARIYNNMGVTYMCLYLFDSAIDCFKTSYEINNNETAYKHYLTAKRLQVSEDEYVKMISEEENAYRMSISIESELENTKKEFDDTEKARHLKEIFTLKDEKDAAVYYSEITAITEALKADYRDMAFEAEK